MVGRRVEDESLQTQPSRTVTPYAIRPAISWSDSSVIFRYILNRTMRDVQQSKKTLWDPVTIRTFFSSTYFTPSLDFGIAARLAMHIFRKQVLSRCHFPQNSLVVYVEQEGVGAHLGFKNLISCKGCFDECRNYQISEARQSYSFSRHRGENIRSCVLAHPRYFLVVMQLIRMISTHNHDV